MKKTLVSILLLAAMMLNVFVMAGCGGGGDGGDTFLEPPKVVIPEEGFNKDTEVTITFYHTMGEPLRAVLDKYIAEFNLIYPNIKIIHDQVGGYDDVRNTISTELAVGGGPNIAYCYPDHVALYRRANKVIALDDLIASTVSDGVGGVLGLTEDQKDAFIDGYWEEGYQFDDGTKMYTLPFSKSTEVLYYNKTFFDVCNLIYVSDIELDLKGNPTPVYEKDDKGEILKDADGNPVIAYEKNADGSFKLDADGNKIPKTNPNPHKGDENYKLTVPTTWDDMEKTLKQIKAIDPNSIPLGYDSESNWFITMCEQYGSGYTSSTGEKFLFNNDTSKNFIKRFHDWYQKGYVTTQEIYGAYTSGLFTVTADNQQKSYMSIGSSAGATHQRPTVGADGSYPFDVGITSIPQLNAEDPKVISQGPSVCIFSKSNTNEVIASWLFVEFLTTSIGFQAEFSITSGYVPVLETVLENETFQEHLNGVKSYSYVNANAQGTLISSFNKKIPDTASSVYTYDETAKTLTMTVGETVYTYGVEAVEGKETVRIFVAGEGDAKLYLTGASTKEGYATNADVAAAKEFYLEQTEGGYRFCTITGGANGGAGIAALSTKVCMEQANAYYTSPAFVGSSAAREEVGVLLRLCLAYEGDNLDAYINEKFNEAIKNCKYMAR